MNLITFADGIEIQEPYVTYEANTKVFRNSQGEEIPAHEAFVVMREFRVREGKKEAVERLEEEEKRFYEVAKFGNPTQWTFEYYERRKKEMLEPLSTEEPYE